MRRASFHMPPLLVVEDNEADFETICLLLKEAGFAAPIHRCGTGEKALKYLAAGTKTPAGEHALPAHVLLDLNLPGVSGLEVLQEIRKNQAFGLTPVTILTTSSHPRDIEACYGAGANSYLTKPVDFDHFEIILRTFAKYWFDLAQIPRPGGFYA